jgi:hypothetical protein
MDQDLPLWKRLLLSAAFGFASFGMFSAGAIALTEPAPIVQLLRPEEKLDQDQLEGDAELDQVIIKTKLSADASSTPIGEAAKKLALTEAPQGKSITVEITSNNEEKITVTRSYLQELIQTVLDDVPDLIQSGSSLLTAVVAYVGLRRKKDDESNEKSKNNTTTTANFNITINVGDKTYRCSDHKGALLVLAKQSPRRDRLRVTRRAMRKRPRVEHHHRRSANRDGQKQNSS